jgi:aspartyl protease family protein
MKNPLRVLFFCILTSFLLLSCSQSGRRRPNIEDANEHSQRPPENRSSGEKTIIKMEKRNGVYQIPIEINDVKMYFIFDTGAGMVSISATEARFLYKQGTLTDKDIIGKANFEDANGNISEGTIIILKTVRVGNRTLTNVQASVVHNLKAPLLLGQTVFEEFGKISIDNNKGEIIFE